MCEHTVAKNVPENSLTSTTVRTRLVLYIPGCGFYLVAVCVKFCTLTVFHITGHTLEM